MAQQNQYYARVREEFSTKYLTARQEADLRRSEVHLAIPEVEELDRALSKTGLALMAASLNGEDVDAKIAETREKNAEIRRRRAALLVSHGYPADYTDVKYECEKCNDSGFVDTKMCSCLRKKLIEASFEASGMGELLREQSFDNFSLAYYQSDPSVAHRMEQIFLRMKHFAETFVSGKSGNLVLFGGTGLGKTHLSSAVAGKVIELGADVIYVSAISMLSDFERQRFGNSGGVDTGMDASRYFTCDLLIIDDLGTEINNQFTTTKLYEIINTRINKHLSTVISTNLTQDEFRKRYWDRITSRVFGEYTVLPFLGTDVRQQKIYNKMKGKQ